MPSRLDSLKSSKSFEQPAVKKTPQKPAVKKQPLEEYLKIDIDLISVDSNIRSEYDDKDIQSMADSMLQYGQLEPVRLYEHKNGYKIIFGHRRYLAAQKAGIPQLKAVISDKPETLDKIYIQAIENEHSVNLSSGDREAYITLLHEKYKQSHETIAEKLGKNVSWIYKSIQASKVREKKEHVFTDAGLQMTTEDALAISSLTDEELQSAVEEAVENPKKKSSILKKARRSKKQAEKKPAAPYTGGPDLSAESTVTFGDFEPNTESETETDELYETPVSAAKEINLRLTVLRNDAENTVTFRGDTLGDDYDPELLPLLTGALKTYYEDKGYAV